VGTPSRSLTVFLLLGAVGGLVLTPASTAPPTPAALTATPTSSAAAPGPTATPSPPAGVLQYPFHDTLPVGAALPSDRACADTIAYYRTNGPPDPDGPPSELHTQNAINNTRNTKAGYTLQNGTIVPPYTLTGSTIGDYAPALEARVSGDYTAQNTDEIIQWAACKWGFDVNTVRAQAVQESSWFANQVGDCTTVRPTQPETKGCASLGLLMIRGAELAPDTDMRGAWPYAIDSTAFNLDYALGYRRACYEGRITWLKDTPPLAGYPTYTAGDEWGCMGVWYSGAWYDEGAVNYLYLGLSGEPTQYIKHHYDTKGWFRQGTATCPAVQPAPGQTWCLYR
jgi:hypothetical protein